MVQGRWELGVWRRGEGIPEGWPRLAQSPKAQEARRWVGVAGDTGAEMLILHGGVSPHLARGGP